MEGIKLSQIAKNPAVAAFFARGERDGSAAVVTTPKQPVLIGGAAKSLEAV